MAEIFNGRDIVARFKENPLNTAEFRYEIQYICATATITHFINEANYQEIDGDGMRHYQDILTFEENYSAGLTRSPTIRFRTITAGDVPSEWTEIDAQNPIPVLPYAPSITRTLEGVIVEVRQPVDRDLVGYVCWVDTTPTVAMIDDKIRYRGGSTSIVIPLGDANIHYLRVAPYDAFGLDTNSAWSAQQIQRSETSFDIDLYPIFERLDGQAELGLNALVTMDQNSRLYRDEAFLRIDDFKQEILADGESYAEAISLLTTKTNNNQTAIATETTNRTTQDSALSTRIDSVLAKSDANEAAIVVERNARTTALGSVATQLSELYADVGDVQASVTAETTARGSAILAETNARTAQVSSLNTALLAAIQTEATTRSGQDTNLANLISQVSSSVANAHARITTEETARANGDSTSASSIQTVQANINGTNQNLALVQQSLTATSNRLGVVEGKYVLQVQSGTDIAGMQIAAGGGTSKMVFQAEAIGFRNPGNGGVNNLMEFVNGELRIPNALIGTANITGANIGYLTIGTTNIVANAITVTHYAQTAFQVFGNNTYQNVISYNLWCPNDCDLIVLFNGTQGFPSGDRLWEVYATIDGNQIAAGGGQKTNDTPNLAGYMRVGAGSHNVSVYWRGGDSSVRLATGKIVVLEARK